MANKVLDDAFDNTYELGELATKLNAQLIGDPAQRINGMASLQQAEPCHLTFLSNPRYKVQLKSTQAGAVLISQQDVDDLVSTDNLINIKNLINTDDPVNAADLNNSNNNLPNLALLIVPNPYAAFAQLSHLFDQTPKSAKAMIHATACIDSSASIDPSASIGAFVVIEADVTIAAGVVLESHVCIARGSVIGEDCWLDKHVIVQHHCQLGQRVRVHAGTVIGGDGFGFAPHNGQWFRIAQLGQVVIGNDVRIGSNCSIDRGALENTTIGNGVIIDNLVQIAHNVQIGDYTAIAANVGIAGSCTVGKHCIIGGASGLTGHLSLCDHVHLTGMSMITKSIVKPGTYSSGTSFAENSRWKKMIVRLRQLADIPLPQLIKQIEHLQARVEQVESRTTSYPASSISQDDE